MLYVFNEKILSYSINVPMIFQFSFENQWNIIRFFFYSQVIKLLFLSFVEKISYLICDVAWSVYSLSLGCQRMSQTPLVDVFNNLKKTRLAWIAKTTNV